MKKVKEIKIAIVKSNYYPKLTKSLEKGATDYLISAGMKKSNIAVFDVSGSWEIPLVVKKIAQTKLFDGIIALGVIIKGETYHFELIANECARALMSICLEFGIPVAFEVLATYNLAQAEERSIGQYNKGIEAAKTILEMIKLSSKL